MTQKFTPRELETALLISEGLTFTEMGERMGISPRTVASYSNFLRARLGVEHKRQIPGAMRELGLIP